MGGVRHATVVAMIVAACAGEAPEYVAPGPPSDNPIDQAIWPRMVGEGRTKLVRASDVELCRRVALDLIGVAPTADQVSSLCAGRSPEEIVRGFLALPRFVEVERRFWIRRLRADPVAGYGEHIVDADRILDASASGAIGYDDLVARLLAHPIMTTNRSVAAGDDPTTTVEHIFETFLGRAPSPAEVGDYANLLRPWRRVFVPRGELGYAFYVRPSVLVTNACSDPVLGAAACTSTLLGPPTTIKPPAEALELPADGINGYYYYELVHGNVPPAIQAELEKPGRLLATRDELWDQAADVALARFLGWWRSSTDEPDTVLPEVQRALGAWFRQHPTRQLRELYVTVMTSLLYTATAEAPGDEELPAWTTGPTKLLEPEQLLDTVGAALQRELGLCDPHTSEPVGLDFYWPDRLRRPQPEDFYGFGSDFYYDRGNLLGGCLGAMAPPRAPGLPALLTHIGIASQLCVAPSVILPTGVEPSATTPDAVRAATTHLFQRLLSRAPDDDELAVTADAAATCFADPTCGTVGTFASELCGALIRSSAFLYY